MCPRAQEPRTPAPRAWTDPQVFTHLALLPGIAIAASRVPAMLELVILQSVVCVLSLLWHRSRERECGLAKVEHLCAHALFVYGLVQTWLAPTLLAFLFDLACAGATLATYVATYASPERWEAWHALGMHVVPGLWSASIAAFNTSLFERI
jgi:hypothetical protein